MGIAGLAAAITTSPGSRGREVGDEVWDRWPCSVAGWLGPTGSGVPQPRVVLTGGLAAVLAWARNPGPERLAVLAPGSSACCSTGRHTCERNAPPQTMTPAGNRAVR